MKLSTKNALWFPTTPYFVFIAPIVGEKECTLVHRDDGHDCFYDLDADLDNVNLDKYPLMSEARIWKTVVKPGEILLIPQVSSMVINKCINFKNLE